ncbi:MAG TPA: DNA methyltransferase [Candidatus Methanoperedens sp.]
MKEKLRQLENIDWEFSDYRGSSSFPADINSLHWYPAVFVPQIPAILIQALTEKDDIILDTFAGAGITLIEAARLKRKFIGLDINPFAVNIVKGKFLALSVADSQWSATINEDLKALPIIDSVEDYCVKSGIDKQVFKWFDINTLRELCTLHQYVMSESNSRNKLVKKVLLSSILQRCCSQRDHYTYVTDSCYPKKFLYIKAMELYGSQAELIALAAETFRKQFEINHNEKWSSFDGIITVSDARNQKFLKDESVDMVVTSPPYLGVTDYVRSMRLSWLFFPENRMKEAMNDEIGARRKRNRKNAYEDYINDMDKSFYEISRVLKPSGFLSLIIGKGRNRACKNDVIDELLKMLNIKYKFKVEMRIQRTIKFRRIQVAGIGTEEIIILNRKLE